MGDKIKILYLIDNLGMGGTQKHLCSLIRNIDKNRFDVDVCVLSDKKYDIDDCFECVNVFRLGLTKIYNWDAIKKIKKFSKAVGEYDILHTYLFGSNVYGAIAGKLAGVKVVGTRRSMTDVVSLDKNKIKRELRWYGWTNMFVQQVICVCEAIKKRVVSKERINLKKVRVIQNGLDLVKFDKINKGKLKNVVGTVTHLTATKGVFIFIEAAKIIGNKIKFVIIGEGELRSKIEKKLKEENIFNVELMGERADAVSLMKSFDIGVNSSILEGSSNTILEYMAASLPVVATNVGGNLELVKDGKTGFVVSSKNPQLMADAILKLLEDKKMREKFGKSGRKRVEEEFTIVKMIKSHEEIYEGLI